MIPEWLANGDLPPGVHFATWQEIEDRLSFNAQRQRLLEGFRRACEHLRKAGDFDACWNVENVDDGKLDPVFWDLSRGRRAQKRRLLGELFPAQLPEGATGKAFMDFFQMNARTGERKGILAIRLRGGKAQ